MNDVANTKTELRHVGTTGECVEQAILSSCERMTTKDKAYDLRVTSREEEGFGTRLLEISGDQGVRIIESCLIDVAMNDKVKEVFVNNTARVDDEHGETSSTLEQETWALVDVRPKRRKVAERKGRSKPIRTTLRWKWLRVAWQRRTKKTYGSLHTCSRDLGINRCKTQETEGGDGEAKIEANVNNNVAAKMHMDESMADGHVETFPTLIRENSAVAFENQRETEETESGIKETKVEADAYDGERAEEVAMG